MQQPLGTRRAAAIVLSCLVVLAAPQVRADDLADVQQLISEGRHAQALSRANAALSARPRDARMRFLRGVILAETGRRAEAIEVFTKLTETDPELPEPYNNLAVLYAGANDLDKAREALSRAIQTNPSYGVAHENLGDIYALLASRAYSKALQLDASNEAVKPKLALIRDLFRPGDKSPLAVAASATPAAAPTAPVLPAPPAPAAQPTGPAVAAAPAPAAGTGRPMPAPPAPKETPPAAEAAVTSAVQAWASAWAARDVPAYLAAYAPDFEPPKGMTRDAWAREREARIAGKSRISVKVETLQVSAQGEQATARFRQIYSADGLNVSSRKTLTLRKRGERWLIVRESTGA